MSGTGQALGREKMRVRMRGCIHDVQCLCRDCCGWGPHVQQLHREGSILIRGVVCASALILRTPSGSSPPRRHLRLTVSVSDRSKSDPPQEFRAISAWREARIEPILLLRGCGATRERRLCQCCWYARRWSWPASTRFHRRCSRALLCRSSVSGWLGKPPSVQASDRPAFCCQLAHGGRVGQAWVGGGSRYE